MKIEQHSCVIVKFNAILGYYDLYKLFNCINMQIMHFVLYKIMKLLTYYTPFYH